MAKLDQYYTSRDFIDKCVATIQRKIPEWRQLHWIDFSAGTNDFLKSLAPQSKTAFDLDPQHGSVRKRDWFTVKRGDVRSANKEIAIGFNPPFGSKGSKAKRFLEHAIEIFKPKYLAVLSPYRAWSTLLDRYRRVHIEMTGQKGGIFYTKDGKSFDFNTPFVILARRDKVLAAPAKKRRTSKFIETSRRAGDSSGSLDDFDLLVALDGLGTMARMIFLKHRRGAWTLYRDGKRLSTHKSPREVDLSLKHFGAFKLTSAATAQRRTNFVKNLHQNIPANALYKQPAGINMNGMIQLIDRLMA
jgi:predicted RNA methylase